MAKPGDLRLSVAAVRVRYVNFDDLERQLGGAENEIEIAERIEPPEIAAPRFEPLVLGPADRFGPAQCRGDALRQQPAKQQGEQLVGDEVETSHGLPLHRIDQARAVDELAFAGGN